jgi:hypothetical protein
MQTWEREEQNKTPCPSIRIFYHCIISHFTFSKTLSHLQNLVLNRHQTAKQEGFATHMMTAPYSFSQQHQQQRKLPQMSLVMNPNDLAPLNLQQQPTLQKQPEHQPSPPISSKLLSETTSTGIPSFPWKLHNVLEDAERNGFTNIVSWTMGGRAFRVHNQRDFENTIMKRYFNHKQYKSFQRQYVPAL